MADIDSLLAETGELYLSSDDEDDGINRAAENIAQELLNRDTSRRFFRDIIRGAVDAVRQQPLSAAEVEELDEILNRDDPEEFFEWFNEHIPGESSETFAETMRRIFEKIMHKLASLWEYLKRRSLRAFAGGVFGVRVVLGSTFFIPAVFAGFVVGACVGLVPWSRIIQWCHDNIYIKILHYIKRKFRSIMNALRGCFRRILTALRRKLQTLFGSIKSACLYVIEKLKQLFQSFVAAMKSLYERIARVLKSIWESVKKYAIPLLGLAAVFVVGGLIIHFASPSFLVFAVVALCALVTALAIFKMKWSDTRRHND